MLGAAPRSIKKSRLERRRDVTIIAGFPVTGFVVLGADGEEGGDYEKAAVRKIATLKGPDYSCVVGGAGDGDFIDLAIQDAGEALKAIPRGAVTSDAVRLALEEVVTDIYAHRLDSYPLEQQGDLQFQLLCAVWTKESGKAQLVKIGRSFSLIRTNPEALGKGSYLARYVIETLALRETEMLGRHAERLCAYVLATVKAHVKDCGGTSLILVLNDAGEVREVPQYVITEDEKSSGIVMDRVRGLFHWTDIIGWRGKQEHLEKVIDDIAGMIKLEFRVHLAKHRAVEVAEDQVRKSTLKPPTDDPKDQPPSPG